MKNLFDIINIKQNKSNTHRWGFDLCHYGEVNYILGYQICYIVYTLVKLFNFDFFNLFFL